MDDKYTSSFSSKKKIYIIQTHLYVWKSISLMRTWPLLVSSRKMLLCLACCGVVCITKHLPKQKKKKNAPNHFSLPHFSFSVAVVVCRPARDAWVLPHHVQELLARLRLPVGVVDHHALPLGQQFVDDLEGSTLRVGRRTKQWIFFLVPLVSFPSLRFCRCWRRRTRGGRETPRR